MSIDSPLSGSMIVGTADKGDRSTGPEKVRRAEGRPEAAIPGGEDDMI
jgi:hypothetical protein